MLVNLSHNHQFIQTYKPKILHLISFTINVCISLLIRRWHKQGFVLRFQHFHFNSHVAIQSQALNESHEMLKYNVRIVKWFFNVHTHTRISDQQIRIHIRSKPVEPLISNNIILIYFLKPRNLGSSVALIIWLFTSIRFNVCENVSGPSYFHPQRRWCMQGQNVTRHPINIFGVCIVIIGWIGGYVMGHCWPNGTSFEQFNIGNQFDRPESCISASGKWKLIPIINRIFSFYCKYVYDSLNIVGVWWLWGIFKFKKVI